MSDRQKLEELFLTADWDDAPMRARRGRGKHKGIWFCVLAACVAFGAVASYLDSNQVIRHGNKVATAESAVARPPSIAVINPPPPELPRLHRQHIDSYDEQVRGLSRKPAEKPKASHQRQTVFNDANYVPATKVNTISMVQPRVAIPTQSSKQKAGYVTVVKESKADCFAFKDGSIECRRYKKAVKNGHNHSCYRSEHKYTEACRRAELYNPVN